MEKQDEARLRLLAHVYSNHVAHFTTGMRIGDDILTPHLACQLLLIETVWLTMFY